MRAIRAYLVASAGLALVAGLSMQGPAHRSVAQKLKALAHSNGSAEREYEELVALGESGRSTYREFLRSRDKDVRWCSADLLCELGNVSADGASTEYLLKADERDVAAMTLLTSICDERSARGDRLISTLLVQNPRLSPLVVRFLMSRKRDDDRRFRSFVSSQTSAEALRSMESGLRRLYACRRHADLLAAIEKRLKALAS